MNTSTTITPPSTTSKTKAKKFNIPILPCASGGGAARGSGGGTNKRKPIIPKTVKTHDLTALIKAAEDAIAEARSATADKIGSAYFSAMAEANHKVIDRLSKDYGAKVSETAPCTRIRMAGISASGSAGFIAALHNWITAAKKRVTSAPAIAKTAITKG